MMIFLFIAVFLKGIDYLNKNKKYVCYGAKMITFGASNKFDQINSLPFNLSQMYENNKINYKSKSAQSRFFFLKNSNFVVFHCLFKRDVLLNVYSKILRSNLTIPNIVDLYANSLIYCIGLVKTGSEIMRLKQYHPTSDAKSRDINNTLSDKKI